MSECEIKIYRYLDSKGLKHAKLGYKYLISAIGAMIEDPYENQKITDVYDRVAKDHGTSGYCVERAIRYAITKSNVSNKEFILRATHELLYD